ncbi:MAG: hypothetical protein NDI94_06820, partial [Candidatus Woesearchaeota archaeon]|nr:hypothetical protein [Candidatus Woesearchaeota archaeon]
MDDIAVFCYDKTNLPDIDMARNESHILHAGADDTIAMAINRLAEQNLRYSLLKEIGTLLGWSTFGEDRRAPLNVLEFGIGAYDVLFGWLNSFSILK